MTTTRNSRLLFKKHFGVFTISAATAALVLAAGTARAQDNYEIQVYASELVDPGRTMVELHSNFTDEGSKTVIDGVNPTDHAEHETVEITHGFNSWFETGFYIFTSVKNGEGWQWVGDHIRPRVAVPKSWNWPVGLSLSTEFGYTRRSFTTDQWTLELRPIIDKQWGRWYFAVNPALEKSLAGLNSSQGFQFAPAGKVSYNVTKEVAVGVEYYASLNSVLDVGSFGNSQEQIFPAVDLDLSDDWEFNFGVGFGLTHSTDHLIFKMILGYRF